MPGDPLEFHCISVLLQSMCPGCNVDRAHALLDGHQQKPNILSNLFWVLINNLAKPSNIKNKNRNKQTKETKQTKP